MSFITVMCSRTGDFISTGVKIDAASFSALPPKVFKSRCQACGSEHAWSKGRAWLSERNDKLVLPAPQETIWLELIEPPDAPSIDEFADFWPVPALPPTARRPALLADPLDELLGELTS